MAFLPPAAPPERRPSPGLSLNFNSNNPFRNRANSPALTSPASLPTPTIQSARPMSTNPFLAAFEADGINHSQTGMATGDTAISSSPRRTAVEGDAKHLFDNLTLDDRPPQNGARVMNWSKRSDTLPVPNHRPNRSNEDTHPPSDGSGRPSRPRVMPSDDDPFASPERSEKRENGLLGPRPRRTNSESSVHRPMTEEEKRAREQRRRDRERRHRERERDGKPREGRSTRPRKPNAGLDLIDKLDVTGIYGSGLFHHDGPFDACNPHRNRKKDYKAPMQAFPTNSKNNTIGGSGPINKNIDIDRIRGTGTEGYEDFAYATARANGEVYQPQSGRKYSFERERGAGFYDPFAKTELQHGEESVGLGTSTFLEGSQASRRAMQRRESENEVLLSAAGPIGNAGGLARKKSLAQRIRGMSQPKRGLEGFQPGGPTTPREPSSPDSPPRKGSVTTSLRPVLPASAGGRLGASQDTNPFFNDYDDAYEKKGTSIRIAEQENGGVKERPEQRARAPSSPMRGVVLERRATGDGEEGLSRTTTNGAGGGLSNGVGGGFLSRVKSLKGRKGKA